MADRLALQTPGDVVFFGGLHRVSNDDGWGQEHGPDDHCSGDNGDLALRKTGRESNEEHRDRDQEEEVANAGGDLIPLGNLGPPLAHGVGRRRWWGRRSHTVSTHGRAEQAMTVHLTIHDSVALVTIDRPDRRNAVDHATLLALRQAQVDALAAQARCLVLTGAPPAFCAGADLAGVESGDFHSALVTALRGFTEMPIPTVAAIDGPALGAGTQLVISCDLRIATERSVFGIPAAKLGLVVDHWTVERLSREMGWSVARAMLIAAQTYRTEQLVATGAVHRVGGLDDALSWARELAALAPLTMASHKLALEQSSPFPAYDELVEQARDAAWASHDANEGRRAFLEKRPPNFLGR